MRNQKFLFAFLILAFLLSSAAMAARLKELPAVIKAVQPSVVNVKTDRQFTMTRYGVQTFLEQLMTDFFERKNRGNKTVHYQSEGSGIILDKEGFVLTNAHVVSGASAIKVQLNNKKILPAKVISQNHKQDLALLQVEGEHDFQPIKMASADNVEVGQTVIAIGTPYRYSQTVTKGIVSGVNRHIKRGNKVLFNRLIQTDAAANPGNSGGPLLTESGEMIGLMFAGHRRGSSINFAIPVSRIRELLPELRTNRQKLGQAKVFEERFGFSVHEVKEEGRMRVEIQDVLVSSEAYRNGLRAGDVLYQFHKTYVSNVEKLFEESEKIRGSTRVYVKVKRNERLFFTYIQVA